MCYDAEARPPLPPITGGAGDVAGREHVLTAKDGTRIGAYTATAAPAGGPGMVILPDIRGLHSFFEELSDRFAEAGVHATAIDYFGRTAGVGTAATRGDDFDAMAHARRTDPDSIAADVAAAVAHVRSPEGGGAERVFTVGFYFGGRASFNQAGRGHGLAGVIGFYGRPAPSDEHDRNAPILLASTYRCPVLGLFGGADQGITAEHVEGFRTALQEAGVPNELITYPGAPHSFFDRRFEEYAEACEDAWRRVLSFVSGPGHLRRA